MAKGTTSALAYALLLSFLVLAAAVPAASAADEICNYVDDDGDTLIDEGFTYQGLTIGSTCDGVGECSYGMVYCINDYTAGCTSNPGGPDYDGSSEICDYEDDDCDGSTDEGFTYQGLTIGSTCDGVGECSYGMVYCSASSSAGCTTNPGGPDYDGSPEVCNGLDDDCDASTDEGGNALCDNGAWCDGAETCGGGAGCQAGSAPSCADAVACTTDTCNEADDSCDHTPSDAFCSDGAWCNGAETCSVVSGCQPGTPVSCTAYNLPAIATCFNNPDANPFTWDFFAGFTSTCNEADDSCTTGSVSLTHTCSVSSCGAGCDATHPCAPNTCSQTYNDYCNVKKLVEYDTDKIIDSTTVSDSCTNSCSGDCSCTDCETDCSAPATSTYCVKNVCGAACAVSGDCASYCSGSVYYSGGTCGSGCECSYSSQDCNSLDGWVDTGATRWVSTGECTQKEQKEQQMRDYSCGGSGCTYTAGGTQWVDTGVTGNKADGTSCNDGNFCTVNDVCQSGVCNCDARDCSDGISCTTDSCSETTDSCVNTPQNSLCDNGAWCDGAETCSPTLGCQAGTPVSCTADNLPAIGTCNNNPDSNPFTWDYFAGFTSTCNEAADSCTTGTVAVTSTCSVANCGAEWDATHNCPASQHGVTGCSCMLNGDANLDNRVNIQDLALVARAFNTKPGDSRWNPLADIASNGGNVRPVPDGKVDMADLILVGKNYGHVKA